MILARWAAGPTVSPAEQEQQQQQQQQQAKTPGTGSGSGTPTKADAHSSSSPPSSSAMSPGAPAPLGSPAQLQLQQHPLQQHHQLQHLQHLQHQHQQQQQPSQQQHQNHQRALNGGAMPRKGHHGGGRKTRKSATSAPSSPVSPVAAAMNFYNPGPTTHGHKFKAATVTTVTPLSAPSSPPASRATSVSPPTTTIATTPTTTTAPSGHRHSSSRSATTPAARSRPHQSSSASSSSASSTQPPPQPQQQQHQQQHQHRKAFSKSMEPPVLSFYGTEPIPLPLRFAGIKRKLIEGREAAVEASWHRLLEALRTEIDEIQDRGSDLIPSINFSDSNDPVRVEAFAHKLRRWGVAVIRGVVPPSDAEKWVQETREYLDKNREFKPPALHDPTCIDLFWTPVQVRARAHPNVLKAQKFAMSFWESTDDLHIARCPVSYADRLRIHNDSLGAVGQQHGNSAADSLSAIESSTVIAQVDSGSLERWEPDGYGRGGTYEPIFRGDWEAYDPWDPAGRVGATSDLYNGAGVCSIFRMFQGILALTNVDQGMVRVLPSPKLVTAYFLLRPFFVPRRPPPEQPDGGKADQWAAYLDASNWTLDKEHSTVIHGAVPGHAQRITERWHPHLHLRRSLVAIPKLAAGDYIIWHCDQAYSIITGGTKLGVPPPLQTPSTELSLLTYTPVCPLTQTNALFMARQRKAFLLGQPGPDFDTLGGLGSEASHQERPGEKEIEEVGGVDGLRAMGLAPWDVEPANADPRAAHHHAHTDAMDLDDDESTKSSTRSEAEAELLRLANIILFPNRYDFYIPSNGASKSGDRTPRNGANGVSVATTGGGGGGARTAVNGGGPHGVRS